MLKLRDIAKRDAFFTIHICNIIHNKIMAYKENKLSEFITTCMIFATYNFSIHTFHYNIILSNMISLNIKFINNAILRYFSLKLWTSKIYIRYDRRKTNFLCLTTFLQSVLWRNFDNGMFCVNTFHC